MRRLLFTLPLFALIVSCGDSQVDSKTSSNTDASAAETMLENQKPAFGDWGVDLAARDETVTPGDDFFRYVNGGWLDSHEIPSDRTSYGVSLLIHERAQERVRGIIEELSAQSGAMGTPEQKVGDYYSSWMNTETLNKLGLSPLEADLDRISKISDRKMLTKEFGLNNYVAGQTPFYVGLGIDAKDPDHYNINIGLSGLGLPERDYYLDQSDRFVEIRAKYVTHIADMLNFAGIENSRQKAEEILALETKIAEHQWVRADRRDRDKTYNPTAVVDLKKQHPDFDWDTFFSAANIVDLTEVNVNHPDVISPLVDLVNKEPLDLWKTYLTYHLISNNASVLSEEIDAKNFEFWGTTMNGAETQLDRWKRGVSRVGAKTGLGEALGQIYVKRYFPESSKQRMEELVDNLRKAYAERIESLDWMSDETKVEAQAKLAAFRAKIGYPDKWLDLDAIKIDKNDLFGNARRIRKFFEDFDMARIHNTTNREEWFMMPQTVNAYYLSNFNEIVFPAAILEPPYFDPNADDAVNYGAIGAIIGHEMGHGFDDQGSKSDAKGVKRNWWNDADRAAFESRTKKLGEQFDTYEPIEGNFVDGSFTMGENIGDLGGVEVAYRAYQLSLKGNPAPEIDGWTGDQRFFLSYGQSWRTKRRDETTLQLLKADPHSPPQFRVNGVVRNVDTWYEAFDVKPDNALYLKPEDRVSIW